MCATAEVHQVHVVDAAKAASDFFELGTVLGKHNVIMN